LKVVVIDGLLQAVVGCFHDTAAVFLDQGVYVAQDVVAIIGDFIFYITGSRISIELRWRRSVQRECYYGALG